MEANPRALEQKVTVLVDVLVDEKGQVVEARLTESNKRSAMMSRLALAQVQQLSFPVRMQHGVPVLYWKQSHPVDIAVQSKLTPAPPLNKSHP
ncbi:energy transducer TonB [Lacimicrobium sp. SS2-24]|uniref:energy transducer TonB n=1 Tax=Lacimicrobium sp. SS2-24 TaxID=2005569 RepID=UPI000B4B7896|nr:energy transducer TonB [Lacimicrobium sp. SS2-24]